jgi:hypothetical protein
MFSRDLTPAPPWIAMIQSASAFTGGASMPGCSTKRGATALGAAVVSGVAHPAASAIAPAQTSLIMSSTPFRQLGRCFDCCALSGLRQAGLQIADTAVGDCSHRQFLKL